MKKISSLLICMLISFIALSQERTVQTDQIADFHAKNQTASQLMAQKEHGKALALLQGLLKSPVLQIHQTEKPNMLYNMACCYALLGKKNEAVSALRHAVEEGYADPKHIEEDTDLDALRAENGYREIVARLKEQRFRNNLSTFNTPFRENISNDEKTAGLSVIWSEARHNFANFSTIPDLNWDSLYLAYLPKVLTTESTLEYYRILQEFAARLKDGHTGVYMPKEIRRRIFGIPLQTTLVEGKVLVTAVENDSLHRSGVVPGLEVVRIDGIPARQYAEDRIAPYQSASTGQDLSSRTYVALFHSSSPAPVSVEFADAQGHALAQTIQRIPFRYPSYPTVEFRMLRNGVAYVALNSFNEQSAVKTFDSLFVRIMEASALVIDIRNNGGGNSSVGWDILTYLTDKAFETSRWKTRENRAVYSAWGLGERWYGEPGGLYGVRKGEPFRKSVVVLTSPRTYSAAEDFAVAFDVMKRGTIIGEPTGGSTGQPLMFPLPGGGGVRICAKHDEYPDGKDFVGVGVQPVVHVQPTVADLRAGRDTVLEAALDFLARGQAVPE